MGWKHPNPEYVLEQLAASTRELRRTIETGDFGRAEQALARRRTEVDALRLAADAGFSDAQIERLAVVIQQGAEAARLLAARRETARAGLAELESARRRLAAWAPKQPEPVCAFDLSV